MKIFKQKTNHVNFDKFKTLKMEIRNNIYSIYRGNDGFGESVIHVMKNGIYQGYYNNLTVSEVVRNLKNGK